MLTIESEPAINQFERWREDEVVDEFWRESMWQVFRGLRCIDMIFWRTRGTCFTAFPPPPSHFNFQHIFSMCNVVGGTWCDFYNRARCFAFDSYIDYVLNVDMTSRAIVLLQPFSKTSEGTSQVSLLFIVCCSYCSRFKPWIAKIVPHYYVNILMLQYSIRFIFV